jgi:hypothetical protein
VREYVAEGPGYRYEVRVEGSASTQEFLDALWDLLAPRGAEPQGSTAAPVATITWPWSSPWSSW